MNITLEIKNKKIPGEADEFIDEELTPFQYHLEELRQYIDGEITLELDSNHKIRLDIYPDLTVSFEDIIESIQRAKSGWLGKDYIWFCEQGRDIYLHYIIDETLIDLSYTEGNEISKGKGDKPVPSFKVKTKKTNYVNEWEKIFLHISRLFKEKLGKTIEIPWKIKSQ
ncbi:MULTISPECIES: hypothetical protein [Pseudomonas]|uniref:hypothetical protein n=1 Tax=Pseudomonas TaxID=286 RepID=UPI000E1F0075|nr:MULTISPECIES: hypothetical protein [Pseudomonas]AXK52500.1 hypothetical protein DWF74_03725 [Pseudomonas protegens]MCL9658918.1 hypothetical protein [Pseudomonas protegens]MDP4573071.1 hypothetical protein [Pseudomonas sp. LPH60]